MIKELIVIGDAMSPKISLMMRATLEKGRPYNGGIEESIKYFGKWFDATIALSNPVVVALDGTLPGFEAWLKVTGFCEDRMMLETMVEMSNYLNQYRRPSDARMRPNNVPLPKHF